MIAGVGPDTPLETNSRGGKQSASPYRFDLMDPVAQFALAEVLAQGAEKYGVDNWRKIDARSHVNHLLQHVYAWLAGDTTDDHLEHAYARAMMALAMERETAQ
jgi:hypothetical protein